MLLRMSSPIPRYMSETDVEVTLFFMITQALSGCARPPNSVREYTIRGRPMIPCMRQFVGSRPAAGDRCGATTHVQVDHIISRLPAVGSHGSPTYLNLVILPPFFHS